MKKTCALPLAFIIANLTIPMSVATAEVPESVLKLIREKAGRVTSFKAEVTKHASATGQSQRQIIYFKRPNKTRIEVPAVVDGREVVALSIFDGTTQWVYDGHTATRLDPSVWRMLFKDEVSFDQIMGGWTNPLALIQGAPADTVTYLGQREEEGKPMYVVKADSRAYQALHRVKIPDEIGAFEFWIGIEDGLLHKGLTETDGETRTFHYMAINEEFPESLFVFTPPAGLVVEDITDQMASRLRRAIHKLGEDSTTAKP